MYHSHKLQLYLVCFVAYLFSLGFTLSLKAGDCEKTKTKLNQIVQSNKFNTERFLDSYLKSYGQEFAQEVVDMQPSSHWIDLGAGRANAVRDYLFETVTSYGRYYKFRKEIRQREPRQKAKVTALALVEPDVLVYKRRPQEDSYFRFITGHYIESLSPKEIMGEFGKANLITDMYGPFAYSHSPDVVIAKALAMLRVSGSFWIMMGNKGDFSKKSTVRLEDGKVISLFDWIHRINGVTVKSYSNRELYRAYLGWWPIHYEVMRMQIQPGEVIRIPHLKILKMEDSIPPIRHFAEVPLNSVKPN